MKQFSLKRCIIAVVLSIAIVFTTVAVGAATGKIALPWLEESNTINKILERDGYIEGIWYPWISLGNSLTSNEVMAQYVNTSYNRVGIDEYGENAVLKEIYNLKALGFNVMGWEGSPYGEGVIFDENGDVLGIKDEYIQNVKKLLEICRKVDMPVLWVINFHSSSIPGYYGTDSWKIISQMYCNSEVTEHYVERFVKPVCEILNEYKDIVVMVSSTAEPENEINDDDLGNHYSSDSRETYGVNQEDMYNFISRINETMAEVCPSISRTCVANDSNMTYYTEMDLDFFGRNQYFTSINCPSAETLKVTQPLLATEFGLGDSNYAEEVYTIKHIQARDDFKEKGYKGWFMWCWAPKSYGHVYSLLAKDGKNTTDFRDMAYSLHYYIMDSISEHRGEDVIIDKPTMLYNTGSGTVEWIASRQASTIDIMRSVDGGKTWKCILKDADPEDYQTGYKGSYTDSTIPETGTVMYKIIARDGDDYAESDPTLEVQVLGPNVNLVTNGDFEDGLNGWEIFGDTTGDGNLVKAELVTDSEDESNTAMHIAWVNHDWYGLHQDGITVKTNTNYILTVKYKAVSNTTNGTLYAYLRGLVGEEDGDGLGDIFDGKLTTGFLNNYTKEGWQTYTISFKTGSSDKLGIDFRVVTKADYYIDDISLYEVR